MTTSDKCEPMTVVKGVIRVGDHVAYVTTDGAIIGNQSGKVDGIFQTRDSITLADVQWNGLGMPKRLSIDRLIKIRSGEG